MPCELAKRIDGQQVRRLERLTVPLIVEFGLLSRNNVAGALTEIEEAERPAVLPTFPLKPLLGNDRTTPSLVDRQVIGDDRIASSLTVVLDPQSLDPGRAGEARRLVHSWHCTASSTGSSSRSPGPQPPIPARS